MTKRPLPEYDAPPIDEMMLGVDFTPIGPWKVPHAGLFWSTILADYPKCDAQAPVPSQKEIFPLRPGQQMIGISSDPNLVRCWFLNEPGTELIQIQQDRFLRNWRRVSGEENYPRYSTLRPSFERDWNRYKEFLERHQLGDPQIIQCEVTYTNNIDKGAGWESISDLSKVTPLWSGKISEGFISEAPESIGIFLSYAVDEKIGRLRVLLNHAFRVRDGKEILQLQLIARGTPASGSTRDILEWMDHGREWIVRTFTDITTPTMHQLWRRKA